jgi:hypothetical protein
MDRGDVAAGAMRSRASSRLHRTCHARRVLATAHACAPTIHDAPITATHDHVSARDVHCRSRNSNPPCTDGCGNDVASTRAASGTNVLSRIRPANVLGLVRAFRSHRCTQRLAWMESHSHGAAGPAERSGG